MNKKLDVQKFDLSKELGNLNIKNFKKSYIVKELCVMLSLDCNLRSSFCPFWGTFGACYDKKYLKNLEPSLTLIDLKNFSDSIKIFSPGSIMFSGGEPLLNDLWFPMAKFFKKIGTPVSLVTNGILLKDNLEKIDEVVDRLFVSFGSCFSIVDLMKKRKSPEVQASIEGLRLLSKIKRKKGGPFLTFLYTISDSTYLNMTKFVAWISKADICYDKIHFQHQLFLRPHHLSEHKKIMKSSLSGGRFGYWKGLSCGPKKINVEALKKNFFNLCKIKNVSFNPKLPLEDFSAYYNDNSGVATYNNYCLAPWTQVNLFPNGEITACPDYSLGNIKKQSFEDIWNGSKASSLREYAIKKLFPVCHACCFFYTGRVQ